MPSAALFMPMLHARMLAHALLFAALLVESCAATTTAPFELTSTNVLARLLSQSGATVTRGSTMPPSSYPFFSVAAQRVVVNGADVQVFEYRDTARANSDAARISPTGTPIGQSQISWVDTPHFYNRDRLIVLYVGHSADVMKLLESVLGAPFASGT